MNHEHHEGCGHHHAQGESCNCGHEHQHGESCNCGHEHQHGESCGCGHEHQHGESCGCGHEHAHVSPENSGMTNEQADVLLAIHQRGYLPIARFALRSNREENAYAVALEPVYLADPKDTMDDVKENGKLFTSLEELDLVTLDYDLPLTGYAYAEYKQSALYEYFAETVREAAETPGFVMDVPCLELGSVALTDKGRETLQKMLEM